MRKRIYVVCACIVDQNRVLLDRRAKGTHLADHWEFPGGKREEGESDEEALKREIQEELGVSCQLRSGRNPIARVIHAYDDFDVELVLYDINIEGEPRAVEVAEIRWFPVNELTSLQMPPADVPLVDAVMQTYERDMSTTESKYD